MTNRRATLSLVFSVPLIDLPGQKQRPRLTRIAGLTWEIDNRASRAQGYASLARRSYLPAIAALQAFENQVAKNTGILLTRYPRYAIPLTQQPVPQDAT